MTYRFMKICVLLLCSVFTVATFAQNSNSTIKGTVEDTSGAVVPGATIELTNVGTSQTLTTTSKGDGFYTFTNLSPANYKVAVTAQGFAQWVGTLTLRVSEDAEISPKLTAASVSTQITVHDVTPVIDRVNPTISDVKNATAIETIPVQNRNILNVLAFSPGVVANSYGGSGAGNTRVNGIPGGSLDYLVDGQTMTNRFTNELDTNPQPTPTFQEVKIITTSGDAQYSRPGIVELVTKSGTNQFHGQAYELNQNNHLQARPFGNGARVPFLQHNEWGAQLGGPVWLPKLYNGRNKTFFFVDFEWIKQKANAVQQFTEPTMTMRQGNLSSLIGQDGNQITIYDPQSTSVAGPPFTRTQFVTGGVPNVIPPNRLNPITQKILGITPVAGLIPLFEPNIAQPATCVPTTPPNPQCYWQGVPNYSAPNAADTIDNKLYTAKVDQLFGPNRLAMRYTYTNNNFVNPYLPLNPNVRLQGGDNGAVTYTEVISPKAVNVVRAGVQYNHSFVGPAPISPPVTQTLGLPTYTNTIAWPSFYFYGNNDNQWTGIDRNNPKDNPDAAITGSDQFSYNKGNHQLMFGFEVTNNRLTTYEVGQPGGGYGYSGNFTGLQDPTAVAGGTYDVAAADTGAGLADFLLGETDSVNLNIYPKYHTRQTEFNGFAQDNWRVTQNLTVNLGLRYAYWTAFEDASGLMSTFDPTVAGGLAVYQGKGPLPSYTPAAVLASFVAAGLPIESAAAAHFPLSLWNMPKNNFEPRVGFAYQVDSNTVLRGGWGIYQWVLPLQNYEQAVRQNPPFSYSSVINPGEINGVGSDAAAAELEFPNATPQFGGPQPLNQFMLGDPALTLNTSDTEISQGGGFNMVPMNPNYKPQTVQEYNLTLSRELPWQTGFQLSYIGNHSYNLLNIDPQNYIIPRADCATAGSSNVAQCVAGVAKYRRAYPVFATSNASTGASEYDYIGYANTNELQAQITHTVGHGLTLQSYFTWGRFLTTSETGNNGGGTPYTGNTGATTIIPAALTSGYNLTAPLTSGAPISQRLRAVYANDPTLPDKTFQINGHYQLPFGKGERFLSSSHGILNAVVSGYNVSAFFLWHSGFWFSPYFTQFSSGTLGPGGRGISLAPGKTGILPESQRKPSQWFNYQVPYDPTGSAPYAGQTYEYTATANEGDFRNNIPLNYMNGPGFNNMDATVYKLTPLWRNLVLDFEAQFLNIYNHQNLAMPGNTGIIKTAIGTPRTIQLQAKFIF